MPFEIVANGPILFGLTGVFPDHHYRSDYRQSLLPRNGDQRALHDNWNFQQ